MCMDNDCEFSGHGSFLCVTKRGANGNMVLVINLNFKTNLIIQLLILYIITTN
jgi:hypothetical protein